MNTNDPVVKELQAARIKLIIEWPIFGSLILQMELKEVDWCDTAATDGRYFYYNREFVKRLDRAQLLFLTAHEVLHMVYDHIFRRGGRDKELWNMACLAWDTPILMADGTVQSIQRIVPGDLIASPFGPSKVFGNMFSGIKSTMEYVIHNRCIRSTENHRYASNEGFLDAETIIKQTSDGYFLNETGRQKFYIDESSNYVVDGFIRGYRGNLRKHSGVSEKERADCESLFKKAIECSAINETSITRTGLSGWYNRWRRNLNGCTSGQEIYSTGHDGFEHIQSVEKMVGESRFLVYGKKERSGKTVFSHVGVGMGTRWNPEVIAAISRNQEIARSDFVANNSNTEGLAISWADAGGSLETGRRDKGIERARFSVREGSREFRPVFDLVTEFGSFFANGILTHNCDFIVNYTLIHTTDQHGKTIGRKIENVAPVTEICYDKDYTDEFGVEELYALLEKKSVKIQQPLDMHLDGDGEDEGDGDEEGSGHPKPKEGDGDGDEKDEGKGKKPKLTQDEKDAIREAIRASLIQAAQQQQNLDPGSVPAGIQRLLDRLLEPKIDWRQMLDNVLRSSIKYDYTYTKRSRRSYLNKIILPGRNIMDKVSAIAWLDGSGSTTQEMVTDFLSECKGIMNTFRDFELTIGTFDTDVYSVMKYTPENADEIDDYPFKGGGGTAPSCCWDYMKEQEMEPHKILLFTDGHVGSDWGDEDFGVDTLFIVHSNPRRDSPWGRTCHYESRN